MAQPATNEFLMFLNNETEKQAFRDKKLGGVVSMRPVFENVEGIGKIYKGREKQNYASYEDNLNDEFGFGYVVIRDRIPQFKAEQIYKASMFGDYRTSLKQKRKTKAKQYAKRNKKFGFM